MSDFKNEKFKRYFTLSAEHKLQQGILQNDSIDVISALISYSWALGIESDKIIKYVQSIDSKHEAFSGMQDYLVKQVKVNNNMKMADCLTYFARDLHSMLDLFKKWNVSGFEGEDHIRKYLDKVLLKCLDFTTLNADLDDAIQRIERGSRDSLEKHDNKSLTLFCNILNRMNEQIDRSSLERRSQIERFIDKSDRFLTLLLTLKDGIYNSENSFYFKKRVGKNPIGMAQLFRSAVEIGIKQEQLYGHRRHRIRRSEKIAYLTDLAPHFVDPKIKFTDLVARMKPSTPFSDGDYKYHELTWNLRKQYRIMLHEQAMESNLLSVQDLPCVITSLLDYCDVMPFYDFQKQQRIDQVKEVYVLYAKNVLNHLDYSA